MANLPVSIQDKILKFAFSGATSATPTLTTSRSSAPCPQPRVLTTETPQLRLTPADVFVLTNDQGPGFIVFDRFLGDARAEVASNIMSL